MSASGYIAVVDVLVIGAGPAGLALGHELQRLGMTFVLVERGTAPGESWRRMPDSLRLVSPWMTNSLPGAPAPEIPRFAEVSRSEYARYLVNYAQRFEMPLISNAGVSSVARKSDDEFVTHTTRGEILSRLVVNATGYFAKPFVPEIPGAATSSVSQLHVANYRSPQHLDSLLGTRRGPVLIVGKRLSAGQAMVELVDAGFEVALSHRSPIQFGAGPLTMWFFLRVFSVIEEIALRRHGQKARDWDVKMPGGRAKKLVQRGVVKTYPAIRHFEFDAVVLEDGTEITPAAVLYATGYQPALDHLHELLPELRVSGSMPAIHEMESVTEPGLFFLGLANQRNFQSRYIRGIRRDAVVLAEQLKSRIPFSAPMSERSRHLTEPLPAGG